ncbi:trypsin-like serine protease [Streptomyces sp. NPDC101118]|uniref:trypsin-like serine protease n=1 Tax=Streptomyces sp. NPDC101118 TaxID=3366109 RepID=UPI0038280F0C
MSKIRARAWTGATLTAVTLTSMISTGTAQAVVGTPAADGQYAFTAKLAVGEDTASRACTATLVDDLWLATAASCFADRPGAPVPAGKPARKATATFANGQVLPVTELRPRDDRDLVLARLERPVTGITPVKTAASAPAQGEGVTAAGFGRTKTAWVPGKLHTGRFGVTGTSATTVSVTGNGTAGDAICKGDTGGPLLRGTGAGAELAGVSSLSWQGGCLGTAPTETRTGAVAARTDDIRPWIEKTIASTFALIGAGSNRALDVAGPAWDAPVQIWDAWGGPNQQFTYTDAKELRVFGDMCVTPSGGVAKAGARLISWPCNGEAAQKWNVNADGTITDAANGLCLNVNGEKTENASPIGLWWCNGRPNNLWKKV